MATQFGDLKVKLSADVQQWQRDLNSASGQINKFKQETTAALDGVGNAISRINPEVGALVQSFSKLRGGEAAGGLGAIAAAAVGLTFHTAQAAKEMANLASIAGVAPEQFQRMAAAAKSVDISADQLSDKLKDVGDKMGDYFQTGGGPMADFFENIAPKVKVTAEQFKKLSGPEALQLYYNSLIKANVSQNEMRFYMEALMNDGTKLIPLLADNGKKMKELGDAAAATGAIMSDDLIAASKQLTTEMDKSEQLFAGFRNELSAQLLPTITATIKHLNDLAKEFDVSGTAGKVITGVVQTLALGLTNVGTLAVMVGRSIGGLAAQLAALASGNLTGAMAIGNALIDDLIADGKRAMETNNKIMFGTIDGAGKDKPDPKNNDSSYGEGYLKKLAAARAEAEKLKKDFEKAVKDASREGSDVFASMQPNTDEIKIQLELVRKTADINSKFSAEQHRVLETYYEQNAALKQQALLQSRDVAESQFKEALQQQQDSWYASTEEGKKNQAFLRQYYAEQINMIKANQDASDEAKESAINGLLGLKDEYAQLKDVGITAAKDLAQAFIDFASGSDKSFAEFSANFLRRLAAMIIQVEIFNALQQAGQWLKGASGGTGIMGAVGSMLTQAFASADGNVFAPGRGGPNLIPFANGGVFNTPTAFPMAGGRTGLLGEAGPEAIMPLIRGTDGKLGVQAKGGGSVINQVNVTVESNGKESADQLGQKIAEQVIRTIARQEIMNQKRAGGVLR